MDIKIKKMHPDAVMPCREFQQNMCFDVVATSVKKGEGNTYFYGIGLAFEIVRGIGYEEYELSIDVRPRGSINKTGMVLLNAPGTVDENFRGEVFVEMEWIDQSKPKYKVGDKVAQIKLGIAPKIRFVWADELSETDRGNKCNGSSGKAYKGTEGTK